MVTFAEECRQLTNEYLEINKDVIVANIKQLCEKASEKGEGRIFYALAYNQTIIDMLKAEGFIVVNHNRRGNDGLSIYWSNNGTYDLQMEYKNEFIGYGPNYLDAGINKVILTNMSDIPIEEPLTIVPIRTKDRVLLSLDSIIYNGIVQIESMLPGESVGIYIMIEKLTDKEVLNGSFELAIVTNYEES